MILDTTEIKAVSYFRESRVIMSSDFITGSGRHISKMRIPSFARELGRELKPTKFMTDLYNELGFLRMSFQNFRELCKRTFGGLSRSILRCKKLWLLWM